MYVYVYKCKYFDLGEDTAKLQQEFFFAQDELALAWLGLQMVSWAKNTEMFSYLRELGSSILCLACSILSPPPLQPSEQLL